MHVSTNGQITHATLRKLTDIKGISEQKAQKIKEIAYKLVPMGFLTVRGREERGRRKSRL